MPEPQKCKGCYAMLFTGRGQGHKQNFANECWVMLRNLDEAGLRNLDEAGVALLKTDDRASGPLAATAKPCRDRWLEPFSSDSIWNTAVGSAARFEPAGLFREGDARGIPDNFHNDQDFLVRTHVDDPLTKWINQGDWQADKHCAVQNHSRGGLACNAWSRPLDGCVSEIRLPNDWTSASDCDGPPDSTGSNCRSAARLDKTNF